MRVKKLRVAIAAGFLAGAAGAVYAQNTAPDTRIQYPLGSEAADIYVAPAPASAGASADLDTRSDMRARTPRTIPDYLRYPLGSEAADSAWDAYVFQGRDFGSDVRARRAFP